MNVAHVNVIDLSLRCGLMPGGHTMLFLFTFLFTRVSQQIIQSYKVHFLEAPSSVHLLPHLYLWIQSGCHPPRLCAPITKPNTPAGAHLNMEHKHTLFIHFSAGVVLGFSFWQCYLHCCATNLPLFISFLFVLHLREHADRERRE